MSQEYITLLENITTAVDDSTFSYSEKSKGSGYNRTSNGLHTAIYSFDNFTGTVKLQATLATDPTASQWFDIDGSEFVGNETTSNSSFNFTGNFVWIRAAHNVQGGTISQIRYSY